MTLRNISADMQQKANKNAPINLTMPDFWIA
jgi:hypothetical protein